MMLLNDLIMYAIWLLFCENAPHEAIVGAGI